MSDVECECVDLVCVQLIGMRPVPSSSELISLTNPASERERKRESRWQQTNTYLVAGLQIQFVRMACFEIVQRHAQIGGQQSMGLLRNVCTRSESGTACGGGVDTRLHLPELDGPVTDRAKCWPMTGSSPCRRADQRSRCADCDWPTAACGAPTDSTVLCVGNWESLGKLTRFWTIQYELKTENT